MGLNMFRGTGEAWFVPSVADLRQGGTIDPAEIAAGITLGAGFNAITGLARTRNPINTPVLRHRVELQIAGPEQFQSIAITVVEEDGTSNNTEADEREQILVTMEEGAEGVLVLSRYSQEPEAGAVLHAIAITVDDQEPNWDLGANAMTTNINVTPSTPLYKMLLGAGS